MYTTTTRQKLGYFEIRSAIQKAIRRCELEDTLYCAAEMDLAGLGNAVFINFLMICYEDVGPAEPQLIVEVYKEYLKWKSILKIKGLGTSKSFNSQRAQRCIMRASYMMATSKKSRVIDYAMHNFEKRYIGYPDVTISEAFDLFEQALKKRELELTLDTLDTLTRKIVDKHGRKITPFKKIWKAIIESGGPTDILKIMEKSFSVVIKKCLRFPLIHACFLVIQDDYTIRKIDCLTTKRAKRYSIKYYAKDFSHDVMKDYVYDKHTIKGKQMGRGTQHFIKVGAKVKNLGYPEMYKDKFIENRKHVN